MNFRFSVGAMALLFAAISIQTAAGQSAKATTKTAQVNVEIPSVVGRSFNLGHADPQKKLYVSISLPYAKQGELEAFNDSVSDPKSSNYRQFISPEEVGRRFGMTNTQVKDVSDYLKSKGFNVTLVSKNRTAILAEGSVTQAESAFGTQIDEFQTIQAEAGRDRYFSFAKPLTLPATIAGRVLDIGGLENFTKPQPRALTATQTRTLYNLDPIYSSYKGEGRTIAISNWDGYRLSNVPLYYSHFGLPTPSGGVGSNITEVHISGGASTGSAQGEGDLDIQMVLGMAPLSNFMIYDGGGDLTSVLTREVNDNLADVISESWGWNLPASSATAAHNQHLSMTAQGITYMAASGDNGTTLEPYSYPNYDGEVLMVGGTIASVSGTGTRTSEVGWSGSGGGYTTKAVSFNTLPSWQVGNGVPTNLNYRLSPDLSLNAAGNGTGAYQFYLGGSLSSGYVGTSFACPVFAGGLGAAEQNIIANGGLPANGAGKRRFGRLQDLVYSQNGRSDVWFDVLTGNNGSLPNGSTSAAHAGWDSVTGWGAVNWVGFVNANAPTAPAAPTNLAASAGNATVSLTWTGSAGATSYTVKRSTTSGSGYTAIATPTTTSYVDNTVVNSTTYYYVVTASNSVGESTKSNQASATPQDTNVISNPGFELGQVNWVDPNNTISNTGIAARTGSWKARLGGQGAKNSMVLYQQFVVPTTVTTPTVSFWLHIETAETAGLAKDKLKVVLRDTSGNLLKTFTTFNNLMAASGYQQYNFSVKPYKGQTVRISLESTENGNKATSFVFDDFLCSSH